MSSNHCSRSDLVRMRSRSPSQPPPQRYSRGMDRRDYYSRSRSADQRAMADRPVCTRSHSSDRAVSAHLRSGHSAPPSPAPTRVNPRSAQTSPSGTPVCSRRGRQLPIIPPKGAPDRSVMKDPSKMRDSLSFKSSDSDVSDVSAMSSDIRAVR
ncbi:regulating synaptic membrane exocytosis protein 2-like, partial [Morone saxatilis]